MEKFISSFDGFGQGYKLQFMGNTTQQSIIGGLFGILLNVSVLFYGLFQIQSLITGNNPQISYFSLPLDKDTTPLFDIQRDLAFGLALAGTWHHRHHREIILDFEEFHKYFTIFGHQNLFHHGRHDTQLNFLPCDNLRAKQESGNPYALPSQTSFHQLRNAICLDVEGLKMGLGKNGDVFTGVFIHQCEPGKQNGPVVCKNQTEFEDFMTDSAIEFSFYGISSYLDQTNYTHPISSNIKKLDSTMYKLDDGRKFYRFEASPIQAQLSDQIFNPFQDDQVKMYNFSSPKLHFISGHKYEKSKDDKERREREILYIELKVEYQQQIYSRQVLTILEVFGNVGGFQSFFFALFSFAIQFFEISMFQFQFFKDFSKHKIIINSQEENINLDKRQNLQKLSIKEVLRLSQIQKFKATNLDWFRYVCLPRCCLSKKQKFVRLILQSNKRIDDSMDLTQIIRNDTKLNILYHLMFSKPQRILLKRHRQFHLIDKQSSKQKANQNFNIPSKVEENTSDSFEDNSSSDINEQERQNLDQLKKLDFKSNQLDSKILSKVIVRENQFLSHKERLPNLIQLFLMQQQANATGSNLINLATFQNDSVSKFDIQDENFEANSEPDIYQQSQSLENHKKISMKVKDQYISQQQPMIGESHQNTVIAQMIEQQFQNLQNEQKNARKAQKLVFSEQSIGLKRQNDQE